jgi:hypothetical protein
MPGDDLGLFDRIKVLPLQVLLGADGEQLSVADLADDNWEQTRLATLRTDSPPRHPPAMAVDKLTEAALALGEVAVRSYDQHALEACFAHALDKICQAIIIERLSRLIGAILDQVVRQLLHLFPGLRLAVDDLVDSSLDARLPAPADPRTPSAAHR